MQFSICPIDDPRKLPNTFLSKLVQTSIKIKQRIKQRIVYKKRYEWYIEWQRMTTSGATNDNKWQPMTTSDNEWLRMTKSVNE